MSRKAIYSSLNTASSFGNSNRFFVTFRRVMFGSDSIVSVVQRGYPSENKVCLFGNPSHSCSRHLAGLRPGWIRRRPGDAAGLLLGVLPPRRPNRFPQFGGKKWYEIVRDNAESIRDGRFDLVWLPPPSFAGEQQRRLQPQAIFQPRQQLRQLRAAPRHAGGAARGTASSPSPTSSSTTATASSGWADFKNPDWGTWAICRGDEAFSNAEAQRSPARPVTSAVPRRSGPRSMHQHGGTTYEYGDFRDIDHTNKHVRRDVLKYLLQLEVRRLPRLALRHGPRLPRPLGRPLQPADRSRPSPWASTTGTSTASSAAGSGTPRPTPARPQDGEQRLRLHAPSSP